LRWRFRRRLDCLISIGGDDTLNEVAAAADLEVPLLPVPAGFGNVLARHLGHRATIASIVDLLEEGASLGMRRRRR
jgi:diacylglycerol kinase family enzyme